MADTKEIIQECDYKFDVSGGFVIGETHKPFFSHDGRVVGFELPDGRKAQLIVALEIADAEDDAKYEYVTSEKTMSDLGFRCLDYDRLEFEKGDEHTWICCPHCETYYDEDEGHSCWEGRAGLD